MEQETSLQLQKPTYQIPVLYINNYVVSVSSPYQGLLRETRFKQDMLRDIIKRANVGLRFSLARGESIIYQVPDERSVERLIDPNISYLRIPCFRYMELTYKNATESECKDGMDAQVKVFTCCYRIVPGDFQSREYLCKEKNLINISTVVKNNIIRLLSEGKSAYIELYGLDQISDFIKITNCFKRIDYSVPQSQEQSLLHACDMTYKPIINSPCDLKINLCHFIFGVAVIAAMLIRGVLS